MPHYRFTVPVLTHAVVSADSPEHAVERLRALDSLSPAASATGDVRLYPHTVQHPITFEAEAPDPAHLAARYTPAPTLGPNGRHERDADAWLTAALDAGRALGLPLPTVRTRIHPDADPPVLVVLDGEFYAIEGRDTEPGEDGHTRTVTVRRVVPDRAAR